MGDKEFSSFTSGFDGDAVDRMESVSNINFDDLVEEVRQDTEEEAPHALDLIDRLDKPFKPTELSTLDSLEVMNKPESVEKPVEVEEALVEATDPFSFGEASDVEVIPPLVETEEPKPEFTTEVKGMQVNEPFGLETQEDIDKRQEKSVQKVLENKNADGQSLIDIAPILDIAQSIVKANSIETPLDMMEKCTIPIPPKSSVGKSGVKWITECPDPKFQEFYEEKNEFISYALPNGELDFESLEQELCECNVDLTLDVLDNETYVNQMNTINSYQYRVKDIQLKVNSQYGIWSVVMKEKTLQGVLAVAEYLKPQARQEGLNHIHMKDLFQYYGRLEGLVKNANNMFRALSHSFETLKSKAIISTPTKSYAVKKESSNPPSSVGANSVSGDSLMGSQDNDSDFDALPADAKVEQRVPGKPAW